MVTVSPYSIGKLVLAFLMLFAEISKSNSPVALGSAISALPVYQYQLQRLRREYS